MNCIGCSRGTGLVHDIDCPFKAYAEAGHDLELGVWFACVHCGKPIGFYPIGVKHPRHPLPPGAVAHTKPKELIGTPNSVPCELYRLLEPRELWLLHDHLAPIEQPTAFRPLEG